MGNTHFDSTRQFPGYAISIADNSFESKVIRSITVDWHIYFTVLQLTFDFILNWNCTIKRVLFYLTVSQEHDCDARPFRTSIFTYNSFPVFYL